jgi:hypothetical protein
MSVIDGAEINAIWVMGNLSIDSGSNIKL